MDREKKLKISITVTIVLAALMLGGMVAAWAMVLVSPLNKKLETAQINKDTAKKTAGTLKDSKVRLAEATKKSEILKTQLAFYRARYEGFPFYIDQSEGKPYGQWDPSGKNPELSVRIWKKYMRYFSYELVPRMEGEVRGAALASNVTLAKWDSLKTEAPPKGPENLAMPPNGFFKPVTATPLPIQITGSLDQIESFLTRIHQGKYLMMVTGGIKLEGSSPRITATFAIMPILLAKGEHVPIGTTGAATVAVKAVGGAGGAVGEVVGAVTSNKPIGGATATSTGSS